MPENRDTISREAAKNALCQLCRDISNWRMCERNDECNLICRIDGVPAAPKWIPVTERLPSAEKEVYVTDGEYIARAVLLDEVFPGDKPCWSYSGLGEITHWCEQIPLPQPPKEE